MPPAPFSSATPSDLSDVIGVLTDIDDTLTWEGRLVPEAFLALAKLRAAGFRVIPVTGRPGAWADQIARLWPVDGVVAENGGLWFYMKNGRMHRYFLQDYETRAHNRARLDALAQAILAEVPGSALASDQPYRDLDLAIDFCEDVPALAPAAIQRIVKGFTAAGATARVSSIHVNGWFGDYNKYTGISRLVAELWGERLEPERWLWVGDSPNDEPLFARFPRSAGVANIARFLPDLRHPPRWITASPGGHGFAEVAARLLGEG